MNQTKILWISMFAPVSVAPSAGSQTFNFYFKQFLKDDDFQLRLISCGKPKEKEAVENELKGIEHYIIYWPQSIKEKLKNLMNIESKYNLFNRNAGLISNSDSEKVLNKAKEWKNSGYNPDIVILEWTNMVVLAKKIKILFPNSKIVASEHDVTFVGYERRSSYYSGIKSLVWKLKYHWEKRKELEALKICDLVLPHNSDNAAILIENGIKESRVHGLVPFYNNMGACKRISNHRDLLFFGAMARPENSLSAIWFIEKVMPRITDLDVRFVILGSNPPENLKAYANDRVLITGFVDSIEPFFQESMCLVAPLVLGAGIKVKILEALSSGIPVLTNDIGIEGIPAKNNEDYYHCVTPEDYEKVIRDLVGHRIDERRLEENAHILMKEKFDLLSAYSNYKTWLGELR